MYLFDVLRYKKMVKEMIVDIPDIYTIDDGVYEGDCDALLIKAKVRTTIENHRIKSVELLEHVHERGAEAEKMIEWINQEKKFNVGMIAGASNSCKVMLKAIENSLKSAS
ncbi:FMN-binding protein [Pseudobutyrivibrio sp.]|uniref:FMN-binding protein n=1 Tax=Pseudobutyrivibrio sp. TaxID=2014367 RepID=UPI001B504FB7|nr:FMN-binding protein [Pseudobutyrivibrio sp.]MBP5598138.1 FMN-binding protein [Pseudobutyrivibrio sp.]MBR5650038.1 FMN-binding protein [Pseudobutyrivibrio sp.]